MTYFLYNSAQTNNNCSISFLMLSKPNHPTKYSISDGFTPFIIGGLSGSLATCLIQPIDTLKVQIQVFSQKLGKSSSSHLNFFSIFKSIKNQKGLKILYTGLDSAILRQIFYGSARLGSYNFTLQYCKYKNIEINKIEKVVIAMISGIFGALVGNPFDVVLVRKQAGINIRNNGNNSVLNSNNNGNKQHVAYKNTNDAFTRMISQEGILSLWTGIKITILRVILINIGQLSSKQIISDQLSSIFPSLPKSFQDNLSATIASILTSFISLPADNIKVKLQKQHKNTQTYKGITDCLMKSIKNQGFLRLWVGFGIYLARGFPHSFVLIRLQQFLTEMYEERKKKRKQ